MIKIGVVLLVGVVAWGGLPRTAEAQASDTAALLAGLHLKVGALHKAQLRKGDQQDTLQTLTKQVSTVTAEAQAAADPINQKITERCNGTFPEPEYSQRVAECHGYDAQIQQLEQEYTPRINAIVAQARQTASAMSETDQEVTQLEGEIDQIKDQLNTRYHGCAAGSPEAVVDCYQRQWDNGAEHTQTVVQPGPSQRSLGVEVGTDPVLRTYKESFDNLESELGKIEGRLRQVSGDHAHDMEAARLQQRASTIVNDEAYLRFKANDHVRKQ